jgi:hypothetical protein
MGEKITSPRNNEFSPRKSPNSLRKNTPSLRNNVFSLGKGPSFLKKNVPNFSQSQPFQVNFYIGCHGC